MNELYLDIAVSKQPWLAEVEYHQGLVHRIASIYNMAILVPGAFHVCNVAEPKAWCPRHDRKSVTSK